jgi:diaminopimelate epimerase
MLNFTKMVGSGNDFIVLDNRENILGSDLENLAQKLCDRRNGIGADGLVIIENSTSSDFLMRIINADGSEAEMCGNGARCAAYYTYKNSITDKTMKFETLAGIIEAEVNNDSVKIKMIDPYDFKKDIELDCKEYGKVKIFFINTGVPHAVIFRDDIDSLDVEELGSFIRYHKYFEPKGTNVNFVKLIEKNTIQVRTYERGVENETLSCGSGSTASAIISSIEKNLLSPITVQTQSKENLIIHFDKENNNFKNVYLEGKVRLVFTGQFAN